MPEDHGKVVQGYTSGGRRPGARSRAGWSRFLFWTGVVLATRVALDVFGEWRRRKRRREAV